MKRVFTIVGILTVGSVAPLGGEAVNCVADQRCPEGKTPPTCCQPPPCQIYEYLKTMRAVRRMTSGDRPEKALRDSKGDHAKAIASLLKETKAEQDTLKSQSKCPLGEKPYAAPNFRVTRGCDLEVQTPSGWSVVVDPMSLVRDFDMCNEMVEAAFAQANYRKEVCRGAVPGNVGWWAQRESIGAQKNIDTTMAHLQRYYSACSSVLEESTRRQLEEAELTMKDKNPALEEALQTLLRKSAPKQRPAVRSRPQASPGQGR